MPLEFGNFPDVVQSTINMYNMLGDRLVADIGYIGKDYSLLPVLMEASGLNDAGIYDQEFIAELLIWLDNRAIKKSMEKMEQERKKLERKRRG